MASLEIGLPKPARRPDVTRITKSIAQKTKQKKNKRAGDHKTEADNKISVWMLELIYESLRLSLLLKRFLGQKRLKKA